MPRRIQCPNGHTLEVDDKVGEAMVTCPLCEETFRIGVNTPPAPPPQPIAPPAPAAAPDLHLGAAGLEPPERDYGEPAKKPKRKRRKDDETVSDKLSRVNLGLGFHYAKCLSQVVAILLNLMAVAMVVAAGRGGKDPSAFFTCMGGVAGFVAILCGGAGSALCFFVPRKSETRTLILVSAALEGGSLFLLLVGSLVWMSSKGTGGAIVQTSQVFSLAGWVMFMIFLSTLSRYLGDETTADQTIKLLLMQLGLIFGTIVVMSMVASTLPLSAAGVSLAGVALLSGALNIKIAMGILGVIGSMRQLIASRW